MSNGGLVVSVKQEEAPVPLEVKLLMSDKMDEGFWRSRCTRICQRRLSILTWPSLRQVRNSFITGGIDGVSFTIDEGGAATVTGAVVEGRSTLALVSRRDSSSFKDSELDLWTTWYYTSWGVSCRSTMHIAWSMVSTSGWMTPTRHKSMQRSIRARPLCKLGDVKNKKYGRQAGSCAW